MVCIYDADEVRPTTVVPGAVRWCPPLASPTGASRGADQLNVSGVGTSEWSYPIRRVNTIDPISNDVRHRPCGPYPAKAACVPSMSSPPASRPSQAAGRDSCLLSGRVFHPATYVMAPAASASTMLEVTGDSVPSA